MKPKKLFLTTAALAAFLTGCASNPVAKFYQELPVAVQQQLLPSNSNPRIVTTTASEYKHEVHHLLQQGYVAIGVSAFRGPPPKQAQIVEQGKKVGADVILFTSEFTGTQQGVRRMTDYQPGQTYTTSEFGTVNANGFGSGGYASGYGTYSGSATTTTPGTFTTHYVPYEYSIYGTTASFWRNTKPKIFGALLGPVPDDLRQSLQRNTGAYVTVVIQDSPAFKANILEGDIIIQIADKPVATSQEFVDCLPSHAGQKIAIKLIRNGQPLNVEVQLNERQ